MSKLICPVCDQAVAGSPLKSWRFRGHDVKRYECPSCKSKFNVYASPRKTYTIPKAKG